MTDLKRRSPVHFDAKADETTRRDDWDVVRAYADEGDGPWLVDLSHCTRWDLQDGRLDEFTPAGLAVPASAGACRLEGRILVNRMNRTQAAIWHLGGSDTPSIPAEPGYTDVSEATVFLALFGPGVFAVAEKLTALDFMEPGRRPPFLVQGPVCHVPCQVATLARGGDGSGGLLLTCSRGYAADMVAAILAAGADHGLRPAGEDRFSAWLDARKA
jgi:hypothetical protein